MGIKIKLERATCTIMNKVGIVSMDKKYFSIGMAGHIDHGKTALTQALTNVHTDRLKEELERNISIELGFAPLDTENQDLQVSIIDVPGHERFIRQMIAGVTGIDLVLLIVAADEGVMPQTKEHLDILHLLGVNQAIVVLTKKDKVDEELLELVEEDVKEQIAHTSFADAPIVSVDSISKDGITELKKKIESTLVDLPNRDVKGSFRLPIDQVFTVQGQGTVVRGTIYEGVIHEEDSLMVLPSQLKGRVRQIQVHNKRVKQAHAGQRTAINIGGVERSDLNRGDVLVKSDHFIVTDTIDVTLNLVDNVQYLIKQRGLVKVHTGTSEVLGNIVFFDRNEVISSSEEIVCQIRLQENIVIRRGDRYIVRRPSPVETLGGGWVIDPNGEKYRFGMETVNMLRKKREGTPADRIEDALHEQKWANKQELIQLTALDSNDLEDILNEMVSQQKLVNIQGVFVLSSYLDALYDVVQKKLESYHSEFPMRAGMNKPEVKQELNISSKLFDALLTRWEDESQIKRIGPYIAKASFIPHFPNEWAKRLEDMLYDIEEDGLQVSPFMSYGKEKGVPSSILEDAKAFLLAIDQVIVLDDKHVIARKSFQVALENLANYTNDTFTLKDVKEVWGVSRKYLIPLLEYMDKQNITKRTDGEREWVKKK